MSEKRYNEQQPIYRSRRDRKPKKQRDWLPILLLLTAFFVAAVVGAFVASSSLFDNKKPVTTEKKTEKMVVAADKTIVMLMGVDERDDDVGRSDTLMIAMLDPKKKRAAILSVPRDTRVKIPRHGFDKINAAYAYGGYRLTQETVEDLLGVEVEHYVQINVNGFVKVIDAIGGVDVDVEKRMYYEDPWDDNGGLFINLYPGQQHMDGKTAITYVRYRDEEGDIGRIARQQKFMRAVMDKVTSPSIIPKIPTIIKDVIDAVSTDLSVRQMVELAAALNEAQVNGLRTEMLAGRPVYIGGISYWIPDLSKLRATIANTLDVNITSTFRDAMEYDVREYEDSVPDDVQEIPISESTRKKLGLDNTAADKTTDKEDKNKDKKSDTDNEAEGESKATLPYEDDGLFSGQTRPKETMPDEEPAVEAEPSNTEVFTPAPTAPSMPSAGKTSN